MPICFLGLVGPMLKSAAHIAAAVSSVVLALALAWVPYSLGLILAGVIAMMVGAEVERRQVERQQVERRGAGP